MKFDNFEQPKIVGQDDLSDKKGIISERQEEEINPTESALEEIQVAENKVAELSTNGKQQIGIVEKSVNLSIEDVASVREEVGVFGRLEKIKDEANVLLNRLKERFPLLFAKEKISDTTVEESKNAERSEYDEVREDLSHYDREIEKPIVEEAKRKRDQLLEARGVFSMSKPDFDTNFSDKEFEVSSDLKQQNVGDCYLVAAIHAISLSPLFETICRSSIKKLTDGSWQVRVPLMSKGGELVTITPEELLPQKNRQFLKQGKKGKIMPDLRRELMPVKGREGLRVLEAAFIKKKFGSVDRLAAEGGRGDEALLAFGGDNFIRLRIESYTHNPKNGKMESPGLNSLTGRRHALLDHILENFDSGLFIATVGSRSAIGELDVAYRVRGTFKFLAKQHAYSVSGVDKEKKTVSLSNPWDTSKPLKLTFAEFKENFCSFDAVRVNSAKLLNNMEHVVEKSDLD